MPRARPRAGRGRGLLGGAFLAEPPWARLLQEVVSKKPFFQESSSKKAAPRMARQKKQMTLLGSSFLGGACLTESLLGKVPWKSLVQGCSAKKAPPRRPLLGLPLGLALPLVLALALALGLALSMTLLGRTFLEQRS